MTHPVSVSAQTADPINYTLSFPASHTHYVEVAASYPTAGTPQVELMMAVWTPGSYLVREFSRHVEAVAASGPDGRSLAVEKSAKNRWTVATGGAPRVDVRYRVYSREMSVRTNWVDADFALLNGAPTFLTLAEGASRPHEVTLTLPPSWNRSMTALPALPGGPHRYRAASYDELVDSPIVLGTPDVLEFTVEGTPHLLVNTGGGEFFDGRKAAADLETLAREHHGLWGGFPYDRYLFLNMVVEAGGGLEHAASTVLMTSRWATRTRRAYLNWLNLASHELFHAWNVKQLRPVELGPFQYERENYTRSLWIVEGFTEYYGDLLVHRAGLASRDEYLAGLSRAIEGLQTTPGRNVMPVDQASFDAWIRYYRPDENSDNVSVSYYTKGAVLAFLLDARIRRTTSGARSLDDVMRAAYARYAGPGGYTPEEFRAVAEEVAGASLADFWRSAVEGTEELDYTEALATLGLRFRSSGGAPGEALLGVTTRNDNGRLVVSRVARDTAAHEAGVNVDDEILAIDDVRVRADQLPNRLDQYSPGDRVSLLVARRERVIRLPVTLGEQPGRSWTLEADPDAGDPARAELARWLRSGAAQ